LLPRDTPYLNRHVDRLIEAIDPRPDERVLEVGCGMGRYTFLLAQRGYRIEGLDLSPRLLERLAEHDGGRYRIPLHAADLIDPPDELAGGFDAVVGLFMLHHIEDLAACFAGVARLLKPGGRTAFVEPNPLCLLYYAQIALTPGITWRGDGGIVRMRPRRIARAMEQGGLRAPRASRFGFFPPALANRPAGARLEAALERVAPLRPLSAFQLFQAERA
jgi:SAM-dependent methyltransferase